MAPATVRITGMPGRPVIGVPVNARADAASWELARAGITAGASVRMLDLATLRSGDDGVHDSSGLIRITHLAPGVLTGHDSALPALLQLEQSAATLNPLRAVLACREPGAAWQQLVRAGVPQPDTELVTLDDIPRALTVGLPLVLKRARRTGPGGPSVRRVTDEENFTREATALLGGPTGALLAREEITECLGTVVRAVTANGRILAATIRTAPEGEWRASAAAGVVQRPVELAEQEALVVAFAAAAVGLRLASVDLLRARRGPLVIDVDPTLASSGQQDGSDNPIADAIISALVRS